MTQKNSSYGCEKSIGKINLKINSNLSIHTSETEWQKLITFKGDIL